MQKENEKAKNTAVEINAKSVRKWEYVPCKSYGPFKLGDRISKYLDTIEENFGYIYYRKNPKEIDYHEYVIPMLGIKLWVKYGVIYTIVCEKKFMFRGYNLIKMDYAQFLEIFNVVPDRVIYKLPIEQENGRCKWQDEYDFDNLNLQIWVWRGKIVTVMAYGD